ncbi:SGNH/GDSL hydrolase family protein [Ancylobacter sp. 6x-1]|uniref:SGNH/GDSL hydrolase family protein n=1 Tax=Ancylobacter crimeensis TaxID=2579147 RepID=A0ABT0D757_9HYPH|nr:SGNH/GDSL hydrolase family protein [Ancylobacter crimeensis]MCK0195793.1 SGNH/GDSL hydrolase family protein [Ancylobacter crimeensis]
MRLTRPSLLILLSGLALVLAALSALAGIRLMAPQLLRQHAPALASSNVKAGGRIRLAVLGDSDSHSYHDTVLLGTDPGLRGGPHRMTTYQWTEILDRLRSDQIDQGEWGAWGTGKVRALFDEARGVPARTPRKEDFRYNFAITGATCDQLFGQKERQALDLIDLMDTDPDGWRAGVVVIRIGINDIGTHEELDELAHDRQSPHALSRIKACVDAIARATALIRERHPDTRIVLVGILNNADWSEEFPNWHSGEAIANIEAGMDMYDEGLKALAAGDPHILFFDNRAWFRNLWGTRDARGLPDYKTLQLAPGWAITNTSGNDPHNAVLADAHAGVAWNALWAQSLVAAMNKTFGLDIRPITDSEIMSFLGPSFARAG